MSAASDAMKSWPGYANDANGVASGGAYTNYTPGPATPYQYKAPSGPNGAYQYFRVDVNGFPVGRFENGSWNMSYRPGPEYKTGPTTYRRPFYMEPALSNSSDQQLALEMAGSQLFKNKTSYLVIGDEPQGGTGTVDLKALIEDDIYQMLKKYLTFMPRQLLRDFFMKKIWPGIPQNSIYGETDEGRMIYDPIYGGYHFKKSYEDMVWAAFIDLFNVANLEYINQKQISAWAWEQQKTDGYITSQNSDSLNELSKQFDQAGDVALALDPIALKIMDEFATLPKLGDPGFEINRQNALKQLLLMKEYTTAQAIVDAYRYTKDTVLGPQLEAPIPFNLVGKDGTVLAEKT